MHVRNVHQRTLAASLDDVGALLDSLASADDRLWPRDRWPAMRFDRPLGVGAVGGHGPIRYVVDAYEPGRRVAFRFTAPPGFHGTHALHVEPEGDGSRISHVLEMRTSGPALLTWPLVFRHLHDALLEDAFDKAERSLGLPETNSRWSPYVRFLRWILMKRRPSRLSGCECGLEGRDPGCSNLVMKLGASELFPHSRDVG